MNCILGHRLLSFLLLMLLACTRRRHSRHAKPYPKVILARRKHLFGSLGGCELHSGPPIALLPTAHASCLHPQAPQSARQTIPKSKILERRKHLFGSFGECELHFWPPKYCLLKTILKTTPKPHPSCSHGAAVLQVVYKSLATTKSPDSSPGCEAHARNV